MCQLQLNDTTDFKIRWSVVDHQIERRVQGKKLIIRTFKIGQHRAAHTIRQKRIRQDSAGVRTNKPLMRCVISGRIRAGIWITATAIKCIGCLAMTVRKAIGKATCI